MRICIVGASRGIGKQTAIKLAKEHNLILASRSKPELDPELNIDFEYIEYDALEGGLNLDGNIDGLLYAPGSINLKPIRSLKVDDFKNDFDINVLGFIRTFQSVQSQLNEGASIVVFSTVAVQSGMAYHASISAAKGAIEGLTTTLAAELAPKLRINAIAPSLIATELTERLTANEKTLAASIEKHPLKRIGKPQDAAELCQFLLSSKSSWITGQIFHLDGGISTIR